MKKKNAPLQAIAPAHIPGGNTNLDMPIPVVETPANEHVTPPRTEDQVDDQDDAENGGQGAASDIEHEEDE